MNNVYRVKFATKRNSKFLKVQTKVPQDHNPINRYMYMYGSSYRAPGPNKLMSRLSGPGKIGPQDVTGFPLPFF